MIRAGLVTVAVAGLGTAAGLVIRAGLVTVAVAGLVAVAGPGAVAGLGTVAGPGAVAGLGTVAGFVAGTVCGINDIMPASVRG